MREANPTTDGSLATTWMRLMHALAMPHIGRGGGRAHSQVTPRPIASQSTDWPSLPLITHFLALQAPLTACEFPPPHSPPLPLLSGTPEAYMALGDQRALGLIDALSVFALVWSAGCTVATLEGRQAISAFLRSLLAPASSFSSYRSPSGFDHCGPAWVPLSLSSAPGPPPEEGLLHDWVLHLQASEPIAWRK